MLPQTCCAFRPEALAFSFNGGKDSTAVLQLLLQGVKLWQIESGRPYDATQGLLGIRTFFFLTEKEFPEVHQFVKVCCKLTWHMLYTHTIVVYSPKVTKKGEPPRGPPRGQSARSRSIPFEWYYNTAYLSLHAKWK